MLQDLFGRQEAQSGGCLRVKDGLLKDVCEVIAESWEGFNQRHHSVMVFESWVCLADSRNMCKKQSRSPKANQSTKCSLSRAKESNDTHWIEPLSKAATT